MPVERRSERSLLLKAEDMDTVERPWGWVVVAASFFAHFIIFGICWSSGIFNLIFLETFGASKAVTSWAGAMIMAVENAAGPLAGVLSNKYGCRRTAITGGIVMFSGLAMSSLAPNIYFLFFSFGFVTGLGAGLAYIPAISSVSYYFDKRRAFAIGLAASGLGFGTFGFPPLISMLYHQYGWRGSFLILSAIILHLCICGALMRPINLPQNGHEETPKHLDIGVFKNFGFVSVCVNNLMICFGISIVYVHLAAYCVSVGASAQKSALLMSVIGIANLIGRVAFGIIGQCRCVDVNIVYTVCPALSGLTVVLLPTVQGYSYLMTLGSLFGFLSGCFGTLLTPVLVMIVGIPKLASSFGLLLIFEGAGTLAGAPFAGWLYDVVQQYQVSLYVGGSFIMASSIPMINPVLKAKRRTLQAGHVITTETNGALRKDRRYVCETQRTHASKYGTGKHHTYHLNKRNFKRFLLDRSVQLNIDCQHGSVANLSSSLWPSFWSFHCDRRYRRNPAFEESKLQKEAGMANFWVIDVKCAPTSGLHVSVQFWHVNQNQALQ